MNITRKIVCGIVLAGITVLPAMAGGHGGDHHRHDRGNDGVRLAAEIVGLVRNVLAPAPVVVHHTPPPPPPRHHEVRHPAHHHEVRAPEHHKHRR